MEDFKSIYFRVQVSNLIDEMVLCDIEKYITDMHIMKEHAVFLFKKTTPLELLKYIHKVFKDKVTLVDFPNEWQMVFNI